MAKIISFPYFENIYVARIMEFQVQFCTSFRPEAVEDRICHLCKHWLMKLKCPLQLNMPSKKNQHNYWSFYPSEIFTIAHFNVKHPVIMFVRKYFNPLHMAFVYSLTKIEEAIHHKTVGKQIRYLFLFRKLDSSNSFPPQYGVPKIPKDKGKSLCAAICVTGWVDGWQNGDNIKWFE